MFHVPEAARIHDGPMGSAPNVGQWGAFYVPSPEPGWEHVSVNAIRGKQSRCPSWKEMTHVKDLFWDAEDVVMQLHPRRSQYVNAHPNVLHLWRPTHMVIPEPPAVLVGPVTSRGR
jgi:hypothetical protein